MLSIKMILMRLDIRLRGIYNRFYIRMLFLFIFSRNFKIHGKKKGKFVKKEKKLNFFKMKY